MTPTEKDIIRIAEEQVLEFYEKYNVTLSERKNYNTTFNVSNETAQKAISNNIPNLVKAIKERQSQRKFLYVASFIAIIVSIVFWYFIITNILK